MYVEKNIFRTSDVQNMFNEKYGDKWFFFDRDEYRSRMYMIPVLMKKYGKKRMKNHFYVSKNTAEKIVEEVNDYKMPD